MAKHGHRVTWKIMDIQSMSTEFGSLVVRMFVNTIYIILLMEKRGQKRVFHPIQMHITLRPQ